MDQAKSCLPMHEVMDVQTLVYAMHLEVSYELASASFSHIYQEKRKRVAQFPLECNGLKIEL